jgi:energy-coupling factor transport system permease protein
MTASQKTTPPGERTVFLARDPRFLMAGFALIAFFAFVIRDTRGLLIVLLYLTALHRFAGLPMKCRARTAGQLACFIVLVVATNAVLVEGQPLSPSIPFVSREGVASGLRASVRILVLYLGVRVFLAVTPAEEIAKGISALLAPFSKSLARGAAMYGFLSVGFMPLFTDEARRITVAQRFRGGGLDGGLFKRIRGVRLLLVPLILSAVHRSAELAAAVELRRIHSTIEGILVLDKISKRDYIFVITTAVVVAAARIFF